MHKKARFSIKKKLEAEISTNSKKSEPEQIRLVKVYKNFKRIFRIHSFWIRKKMAEQAKQMKLLKY